MSDQRSSPEPHDGARSSDRLSPEVKEFLHMLQAIETHPNSGSKASGEQR